MASGPVNVFFGKKSELFFDLASTADYTKYWESFKNFSHGLFSF